MRKLHGSFLGMSATLSLCPVLHFLRDRYPGLFDADIVTMQQFMWQLDIVHTWVLHIL